MVLSLEINGSGRNLFVLKALNPLKTPAFSTKEYDTRKNVSDRSHANIASGIIVCFETPDVLVCRSTDFTFSFTVSASR